MDGKRIGTHNSMTYLKPSKWYMYMFRFAFRCQSLTIDQQLECGIRVFDLRVRMNKNNKWVFAHGLVEFKGDNIYDVVERISKYNDCKVRIMWETTNEDYPIEAETFISLCRTLESQYPNIKFFGGTSIASWKNWYNFHPYGHDDERWEYSMDQFVSSLSSFELCGLWPWLYTTIRRKKTREWAMNSTKDLVTLDFVRPEEID